MTQRISTKAKIGKGCTLGENIVINDHVVLGDNSFVGNFITLGEPLDGVYSDGKKYRNPRTVIGNNAIIRSHTIIYAGCVIGENFRTGHGVVIRENTRIGDACIFGTLSQCDGNVQMGDYVLLHNNVFIATYTKIGNRVSFYPCAMTLDSIHPPCGKCRRGPSIADNAVIGGGSVIFPGVAIGKGVVIGAGAIVTKNVNTSTVYYTKSTQRILLKKDISCKTGKGIPFVRQQ